MSLIVLYPDEAPERITELFRELEATCAGDPSIGGAMLGLRPLVIGGFFNQLALISAGRAREAAALLPRLLELTGGSGNPIELGMLHQGAARGLGRRGDHAGALEAIHRAVEQIQRTSNPTSRAAVHASFAVVARRAGRLAEAERELEAAIRIGLDGHVSATAGTHWLGQLATLRLELGNPAGAREAAERGLAFALEHQLGGAEAANRVALARVLLVEQGEKATRIAREEVDRAEALARERNLQTVLALVEETRAELAALEGDGAARERALREAARLHRACGDALAAEQLEAQLAS